ncbi:hypothetical protein [Endozoicomonas sp.]|uniref:hypothetical protein n=1 Tax=Endozoicomonas sp. TaxID=1892382 RepID=UPI003AF5450E
MTIYFFNEYNKAQPIPETRKKKGKSPTDEKTHILTEKHPIFFKLLQCSTEHNTLPLMSPAKVDQNRKAIQ